MQQWLKDRTKIYIYIHTERLCSMQEVTINGNSPEMDIN